MFLDCKLAKKKESPLNGSSVLLRVPLSATAIC